MHPLIFEEPLSLPDEFCSLWQNRLCLKMLVPKWQGIVQSGEINKCHVCFIEMP